MWEFSKRGDRHFQICINRNISIALIFSIAVHLLLLLTLAPKLLTLGAKDGKGDETIIVSLAPPATKSPPPSAAASIAPEATPAPAPKPAAKRVKPKIQPQEKPPDKSPNEIIAVEKPAPESTPVPLNRRLPVPAPAPEPGAPTDMMSYVNAARARRQAAEGYTERDSIEIAARDNPVSEDERRSAIIRRNMQERGTSGIFQIREISGQYARFSFLGWKGEFSGARQELIDVEAGPDGDINRAIAKKMIEIIRRDYSGDFNWESKRLGRTVTLSARKEDNDGLEDFLISEFFGIAGIVAR